MFKHLISATPRKKMRRVKKRRNDDFTTTIWENYVQHTERLMKDSWEAETSIENSEVPNLFVLTLERTLREKVIQMTGHCPLYEHCELKEYKFGLIHVIHHSLRLIIMYFTL
jgi:hypothetical protein